MVEAKPKGYLPWVDGSMEAYTRYLSGSTVQYVMRELVRCLVHS